MAVSNITLAKNIDWSKLSYGAVKPLGTTGGKIVPMYYAGKPLILQTSELTAKFGLGRWDNETTKEVKYSIEASFANPADQNKTGEAFFNAMTDFDKKLVQDAMSNSMDWFRKKIATTEVVEALYTPSLRYSKDKETGEQSTKFPPMFRLNLPYKDGRLLCKTYNDQRQEVDLLSIENKVKGAKVMGIVRCAGVWLVGGKFGCTWKVEQLKVTPNSNALEGFAFQDMEDEDTLCDTDDDDAASMDYSKNADVNAAAMDNCVSDPAPVVLGDDDDDDIEKPTAAAVSPVAAPAKKKAAAKAK